ncbi:hypothetical protein WKI68_31535 [Streptomyces sp. MS1.HAVA.3]|uniref:Uncharacterized protein n=1 Tax=Streptomyces caledonius TaxID=3134107 RepID=A0ABU8U9Q1_9ACTN
MSRPADPPTNPSANPSTNLSTNPPGGRRGLHHGFAVGIPRARHRHGPMSVCLAVLTGLVLLFLGSGLAGARGTAPLGGASRTPGRSGGGPDPPSPRELLTRLAVLRI